MSLVVTQPKRVFTPLFIDRLSMVFNTVAIVDIAPGNCRDSADSFNIINAGTLSPDLSVSGVNGLDTGVEAVSTWYAVHIIADTTGTNPVAGLFSLSSAAPTLPVGYDVFRRVGWVRNNSAGNIIKFFQGGVDNNRTIIYDSDLSTLQILVNGSAITWTAISAATLMPPTSTAFLAGVYMAMDNWNEVVEFRVTGSTISASSFRATGVRNNNSTFGANGFELFTNNSQQVDYKVSVVNDFATVAVRGYRDNL